MTEEGSPQGLLRSNLVVAAGTALSRITGFVRIAVLGAVLQRSALYEAYDRANNSPNAVYELVIGGVLSAGLVPVFTRHLEDDDEEAISAVIGSVIVVLLALTAVAVLAAPLVFHASAWNVEGVDPGAFRRVGTSLARIFLVQILFYGIFAVWAALLNARRRFFAPAWAPVLSNVVVIGALWWASARLPEGVDTFQRAVEDPGLRFRLGVGATVGIAAMTLGLIPALARAGITARVRPNFRHPAVVRVFKLSTWTFGYAAANIVTALIVGNIAGPGSGRQAAYGSAYTLFQLPHGILAVTLTTTLLPEMARRVARKDREGFIERSTAGIRLVALVMAPAAAVFLALRRPISQVLLERGKVTPVETLLTSDALAGFAVGLAGFSVYLFVLRCFYAHADTRTPFVINLVECVLNLVLGVILFDRFGVLGLGLGFGLAYVLCALWAIQVLGYKVPGFAVGPVFGALGRTALAGVVAAEIGWFASRLVAGASHWSAAAMVGLGGLATIGAYAAVIALLSGPEVDDLHALVRRSG